MKSLKDSLLKINLITLAVAFIVLFGIEAYNIKSLSDRVKSVETTMPQETLAIIERTTQGNFLILGVGVLGMLGLSSLATLLIGLKFHQTLSRLSNTTRLIAKGDYNATIEPVDDADIGMLAKAIDDLRQIVKRTKTEIESILPSTQAQLAQTIEIAANPVAQLSAANSPAAAAALPTSRAAGREDPPTPGTQITNPKILVVDDDPDIRQIMATVLPANGIRVQLAKNGEEALRMIAERKPDLVLLDVMMPNLSGYEVCRRIRETFNANELPVVMLTARSEISDLKESFDAGANDFITKPFTQQEVIARIRAQVAISSLYLALRSAERDLANLKVRQSENRFKKLFDATFEGIIIHNAGRIIDINDAATRLFELSAEKLIGFDLHLLLPAHVHGAFEDSSEELNATTREGVALKATGEEFPMEFASRPYEFNGQKAIISCVRDITSRKATELKLKHQQQMLMETAKMRSLGQMAGGIAHEINNPLTIIDFSIQQIKEFFDAAGNTPALIQARLRALDNALPRIVDVVGDLRSFCRESYDDPFEKIPVQHIIDGALNLSRSHLESMNINLTIPKPHKDLMVECRKSELVQALHNVILNARDAVVTSNDKWIRIDCDIQEGYLCIGVTDSGVLPKNILDRIMEPFFTTKEVGRGKGMGLSVSLGLVKGHGGKVYLDSSSPHTRFVIEVPLKQSLANLAAA